MFAENFCAQPMAAGERSSGSLKIDSGACGSASEPDSADRLSASDGALYSRRG